MRLKSNISALNASIALSINEAKLAKNLEKLSSGFRINRAGDDAAGLAISEQMRSLISGMNQAELNARDGLGLLRTGEGAMQEIHAMLIKLNGLAVQSANGVYKDDEHRALMQEEADRISQEIDRISKATRFNYVGLFQDEGFEAEGREPGGTMFAWDTLPGQGKTAELTLADVLAETGDKLKNIIYTETTFDYEATQAGSGTNSFTGTYKEVADTLQASIIPQVVTAITDKYKAFNYLNGSSIGIGLKLESNPSSSVLASVTVGTSYSTSGGVTSSNCLSYTLTVNMAKVGDLKKEADRSSLEQTIAHEMIHAFMDEATTVGMTGISSSGKNDSNKFPSWFVEGMAQTASGPGNWMGALGLSQSSSEAQIRDALQKSANALGSGTSASEYGTGYLACMYLGYRASGAAVSDMSNGTDAAKKITEGLNNILTKLINGKSLDTVIWETMGSQYGSINLFEKGFANDPEAQKFVRELLKYTSRTPDGNTGGGLISGDLSKTDPVPDGDNLSGLKLFALDSGHQQVKNEYPADITVLSGGGATVGGVKPIQDPVTYPKDSMFKVEGGSAGTDKTSGDYYYDSSTGTLHIRSDAALKISGGAFQGANGVVYGNIVINDGVNANLTLSGVNIDASKRTGSQAGIEIGKGSMVNLTVEGTNTVKGGGEAAGIQLDGSDSGSASSVIIKMTSNSVLNAAGGTAGSGGGAGIGSARKTGRSTAGNTIRIEGEGTVNASGGMGAAAIGGSEGGCIGAIDISGSGLNITAVGGAHGAGIGGGWFNGYSSSNPSVDSILITGNTTVNASSQSHGTGIGSGCHGAVNLITIGDGRTDGNLRVKAVGGDDGAGIGAGWNGRIEQIVIKGGTVNASAGTRGAGIGSGYQARGGNIEIHGGTVVADGSTNSSGIGSGMNGTVGGVTITGGTITADGGWTNDGGNIGGYTDTSGKTKAKVTIAPSGSNGLTIKAGEKGEGKYITTGAVDGAGNKLYALDMKYISGLLQKGDPAVNVTAGSGSKPLSFPLKNISVVAGGQTYSWTNLKHMTEDSAYIWIKGEDIKLSFMDQNGTAGTVDLKFFEDYGLWRVNQTDLPPELPREPGYVTNLPSGPGSMDGGNGAIVLQVGPNVEDTFRIPRFYLSSAALGLDHFDISTQEAANNSITQVEAMVNRVSEIRGAYGALDNALEHIINSLNISKENLTAAESRVRDTDMASELTERTKHDILVQSTQAMLAQANALPETILQLLR